MDATPLTARRTVWRGLTRRCPVCGASTFHSWFGIEARCPRCNFPTNRVGDQWIGALGMNTIVSFSLLAGVIAVGFIVTYPDPPVGVLLAVSLGFAGIFPILFYPVSKSLWSGIDVAMRPVEPGDDVDVRYLPVNRREAPAGAPRR